jgi:hypothetical protein
MKLLVAAFSLAMLIVMVCAENEGLEDREERRHVNRMADESRKHKMGRRHKYSEAGL